ncbi:hypothetical protein MMK73_003638 [Providencia rettgeri]|uniref:hypothetical protein n=1 Tax=Providencia sp. TaxID=589 RepID=UPI0024ABA0A3|nr:hypothetical protein [Providencia rettgeri]
MAERSQHSHNVKYDEKKAGKNRLGEDHHYSKWGSRPAIARQTSYLLPPIIRGY